MAIALAICFAVAIVGELRNTSDFLHSPIDQNAAAQHKTKASDETPKESAEQAIARYNYWLTIFTAVLASATVILGFATVGLLFISARQLWHIEREAREARRRRWEDQLKLSEQLSLTRQSVEAAKKSADAAVAADRAWFYVVIDHNFLDCINAVNTWDGQIPNSAGFGRQQLAYGKNHFQELWENPRRCR